MKGYSEVSVDVAAQARLNFKAWYKQADELFDELVERYYEKHCTNGSRWVQWRNKKKTPGQFLLKRINFCESYSSVLHEVCNDDKELGSLEMWENSHREKERCKAIRALLNASTGKSLLLDQDLCSFVERWK